MRQSGGGVKHENHGSHCWPVPCICLHAQQPNVHASQHVAHGTRTIPQQWIYRIPRPSFPPILPCLTYTFIPYFQLRIIY